MDANSACASMGVNAVNPTAPTKLVVFEQTSKVWWAVGRTRGTRGSEFFGGEEVSTFEVEKNTCRGLVDFFFFWGGFEEYFFWDEQ